MKIAGPSIALFALLVTADAITPSPEWFSHLLEAAGQLVLLMLYLERRLTKLETKLEPLWEDYKERKQTHHATPFRAARD